MLALINPAALPALRIVGTFFLIINLVGIVYIFRNRHRFFGKDPSVPDDIPAVRKLRVEVILIPWSFLTMLLIVLLIQLWRE
jgi:ABC-type branched-subunit amino acid transport system permease subunit